MPAQLFSGVAGVTLKSRAMPPESDHASKPAMIYKYADRDGVEKILSNRTLRFARPSEMNDPFDVYVEDLLGMDLEEVHERGIDALCDLLTKNPQEYADRCGVPLESAEASAKILRNGSDERRAEIRQYLKSVDIAALSPEYKALRAEQPALRGAVVNHLRNCAIFCASRTPANLLMWAHCFGAHKRTQEDHLRGRYAGRDSQGFGAKTQVVQPLAQTLHLNAHELLVWANRETSGDGYRHLKDGLERLSGTRITPNLKETHRALALLRAGALCARQSPGV
jgi:hypothetical protein